MNKQDATHLKNGEGRRDWNKWDAALLVIIIVFVILVPAGGFFYLCGRFSPYLTFLVVWFVYPGIVACLVLFIVASTRRLLLDWKRCTRRKRLITIVQIGIPIVFIASFVISVTTPIETCLAQPGYKPYTYGFRERIRSKADIDAIQDWLRTLSREDCTGENIDILSDSFPFKSRWPDSIDWPKSLKAFNPHYVKVGLDENGNPKVRLTWGGALAHWGVEIGMEDMEIPPSDFSRWGEYRLPLERGVYVWYELQ